MMERAPIFVKFDDDVYLEANQIVAIQPHEEDDVEQEGVTDVLMTSKAVATINLPVEEVRMRILKTCEEVNAMRLVAEQSIIRGFWQEVEQERKTQHARQKKMKEMVDRLRPIMDKREESQPDLRTFADSMPKETGDLDHHGR